MPSEVVPKPGCLSYSMGLQFIAIPQHGVTDPVTHAIATSMQEYHLAKQIKLPDTTPASAGGLNKTSTSQCPKLYFTSTNHAAIKTGTWKFANATPNR